LPALGVDVPEARSLRSDGALSLRTTENALRETTGAVRDALAFDGSIGVIAAEPTVPAVEKALRAAGIEVAGAEDDSRVTVLPATLAKGLEYDHVIVVEPAEIVAAEARGLNRLFVVLTRAVSRLDVIHARPLPAPLDGLS
jgi:hypothetical protein